MKQENNTLCNLTRRAAMILLLTVMTTTAALAETSNDGGWSYSLTADGKCNITGFLLSNDKRELTIPKTLDGKTVISISPNALSGFTKLTTIKFYQDASIQNMPYVQNNTNFTTVELINDAERSSPCLV